MPTTEEILFAGARAAPDVDFERMNVKEALQEAALEMSTGRSHRAALMFFGRT